MEIFVFSIAQKVTPGKCKKELLRLCPVSECWINLKKKSSVSRQAVSQSVSKTV